jgi:hypothetical protein
MRSQSSRLTVPAARADSKPWIDRRPPERDSAAIFSRQVEALRELYERSRLDRDARRSDVRR